MCIFLSNLKKITVDTEITSDMMRLIETHLVDTHSRHLIKNKETMTNLVNWLSVLQANQVYLIVCQSRCEASSSLYSSIVSVEASIRAEVAN